MNFSTFAQKNRRRIKMSAAEGFAEEKFLKKILKNREKCGITLMLF